MSEGIQCRDTNIRKVSVSNSSRSRNPNPRECPPGSQPALLTSIPQKSTSPLFKMVLAKKREANGLAGSTEPVFTKFAINKVDNKNIGFTTKPLPGCRWPGGSVCISESHGPQGPGGTAAPPRLSPYLPLSQPGKHVALL